MTRRRIALALPLLVPLVGAAPRCAPEIETLALEGFEVHVDLRLRGEQRELGDRALRLLETKLYEVGRVVPPAALAELREVPIWLGVEDEHGRHPCACYHPSREWLAEHGYDPRKAGAVDIANAERFLAWTREQPMMVLHELAHAYHHRVLGHDQAELVAAYARAQESGAYDAVLRASGRTERAYALNNVQEFFAEASEAWFGANDFYPFVRAELRAHDPEFAALLARLWGEEG